MIRKFYRIIKKLLVLFFVTSVMSVIVLRYLPVYFTPLMGIRVIEQVKDKRRPKLHHNWVAYNKISDNLKRAVIASEDQLFYQHNGFDKKQIQKSIEDNKKGKRLRGASTISQQTAKNIFLWPHSSWFRKGLEAYFTVLIELLWSKDRILHVYLNSIEMGDGVYGAEAVAQHHFNISAQELSRNQSALIAATLPNPLRFSSKSPSLYVYRRQAFILEQMRNIKLPERSE